MSNYLIIIIISIGLGMSAFMTPTLYFPSEEMCNDYKEGYDACHQFIVTSILGMNVGFAMIMFIGILVAKNIIPARIENK